MKRNFVILLLASLCSLSASAKSVEVSNAHAFNEAAKVALAGDTIILKSGVWNDSRLFVKRAEGTPEAPIVVMAERMGDVILMGNSSICISGSFVHVSGLVFTGVTGGTENKFVIDTKTSKDDFAYDCVISDCVVDSFNPLDKDVQTTYVSVYGKRNIVENCYLAGKTNKGPTLIVWPNDERSQENYHRIRRNYIGTRPSFGANGGETLRIGTSTVSKSNSNTIIEENYFERCDGEVEIISLKSCENQVINNTFFECQGGMTIRHGDRNVVTGNFFNGNEVQNTGGVRIINEGHTVSNNLFYKLRGKDFYCTLAVMNGVPNTLINGYHKVRDVEVKNNTFVECGSYFELCVGKGYRDRDDKPENVNFTKNMIYGVNEEVLIKEHDTDHGVKFKDNVIFNSKGAMKGSAAKAVTFEMGEMGVNIPIYKDYGIDWPEDKFIPSSKNCGAQWYLESLEARRVAAAHAPRYIPVAAGENNLACAIARANNGDVLVLADGAHVIMKPIDIYKDLTILAFSDAAPVIELACDYGFELYTGKVTFEGIAFDGAGVSAPATALFATGAQDSRNFHLVLNDCSIKNFTAEDGAIYKAGMNACADLIALNNCSVSDSFRVLDLAAEVELKGKYNSEYVVLKDCEFSNITEWVVNYIRLGVEDSTLGGSLSVEGCSFENVSAAAPEAIILTDGIKRIHIGENLGL